MQCPKCGINNRGDAKFCTKCGYTLLGSAKSTSGSSHPKLGSPSPVVIGEPIDSPNSPISNIVTLSDAVEGNTPYLEAVFLAGLRTGERVSVVDFPASIGRDPSSTLAMALNDTLASTRHAQITYNGRSFALRDMGSTNGTYYQGKRVKEMMLSHGDVLEFGIGGPKIRFEIPSASGGMTPRTVKGDVLEPPPSPAVPVAAQGGSSGKLPNAGNLPAWARNAPMPPSQPGMSPPFEAPSPSAFGAHQSPVEYNGAAQPVPPTIAQPPMMPNPMPPAANPAMQPPYFPQQAMPHLPAPTAASTSQLGAWLKLGGGLGLLVAGIAVAVLFGHIQILVGFMICLMLIGLGLMIWGALQLILGNPSGK